jgi:hypothetical protein
MKPVVVSHINADGDIVQAWLDYYLALGAGSFHLIVHGPHAENARLYELLDSYPIHVEDAYEGEFTADEKRRRCNAVLATLKRRWVLFVDSDEFVEFPYDLPTTIRVLKRWGANTLSAPMVQRFRLDGSLDTPAVVDDPFRYFPGCSVDLYRQMGVNAGIAKYPLFFCGDSTALMEGGNHHPPHGTSSVLSPLLGVTHHFKWRRRVLERLSRRANSGHSHRHQSVGFLAYLERNGYRVPTAGCFVYSTRELFRRGLLRKASLNWSALFLARRVAAHLPAPAQDLLRQSPLARYR